MIITIDGPAGSGKSTVAAQLAERLSIAYLDTGAMYRAITLCALAEGVDMDEPAALEVLALTCEIRLTRENNRNMVWLNDREVTEAIRSPEVTASAHKIAGNPAIREQLVIQQRNIARQNHSLVTEGRDQGTVVFPLADFKFYLDAKPECRAERRWRELKRKNPDLSFEEILDSQQQRDQRDSTRAVAPLQVARGAIVIDTTDMTIEEVVDCLYCHVKGERK
jgi:cytidylate kinase